MTVVHQHPHPLAMRVVSPTNPEILRTYGMVRVEDWDDRVSGLTHLEKLQRGTFPETKEFSELFDSPEVVENQSVIPRTPVHGYATDIVRCHSTTTGQMILLADVWLPAV